MSETNGNGSFWKPLAIALMSALVAVIGTGVLAWPKDIATKADIQELRSVDIQNIRASIEQQGVNIQKLAVDVATVKAIQLGRTQ